MKNSENPSETAKEGQTNSQTSIIYKSVGRSPQSFDILLSTPLPERNWQFPFKPYLDFLRKTSFKTPL